MSLSRVEWQFKIVRDILISILIITFSALWMTGERNTNVTYDLSPLQEWLDTKEQADRSQGNTLSELGPIPLFEVTFGLPFTCITAKTTLPSYEIEKLKASLPYSTPPISFIYWYTDFATSGISVNLAGITANFFSCILVVMGIDLLLTWLWRKRKKGKRTSLPTEISKTPAESTN